MHLAEVRVSDCCSLCTGRGFSDYVVHTEPHMTDEYYTELLKNLFDLRPCKMYLWSGKMRFCPRIKV